MRIQRFAGGRTRRASARRAHIGLFVRAPSGLRSSPRFEPLQTRESKSSTLFAGRRRAAAGRKRAAHMQSRRRQEAVDRRRFGSGLCEKDCRLPLRRPRRRPDERTRRSWRPCKPTIADSIATLVAAHMSVRVSLRTRRLKASLTKLKRMSQVCRVI